MAKKKRISSRSDREFIDSLFEMAEGHQTVGMMLDMALSADVMVRDAIDDPANGFDRAAPVTTLTINGTEYEVQLHLVRDRQHWLKGDRIVECVNTTVDAG